MTKIEVYHIDSGVPVPESSSVVKVPLSQLEVGESILFPLERRNTVQTAASKLKKSKGWDFTVKKMDSQNARVWRVS